MSPIHLELLGKDRLDIFARLKTLKQYGYLAGGTALALQLAHRKSFDFDVFVDKPISNRLRLAISQTFGSQTYSVNTEDQLTFSLGAISEMTFLWYYWKPISPLVPTTSMNLASILDVAADKAHTLGRRAVWRDYVDLFVLLKEQSMTIGSIIHAAEKKFQGDFVKTQFIEQLGYFGDVRPAPIEFIGTSYSKDEIQSYLTAQVSTYLTTILPEAT
jgi:hypothetical protein